METHEIAEMKKQNPKHKVIVLPETLYVCSKYVGEEVSSKFTSSNINDIYKYIAMNIAEKIIEDIDTNTKKLCVIFEHDTFFWNVEEVHYQLIHRNSSYNGKTIECTVIEIQNQSYATYTTSQVKHDYIFIHDS